MLTNFKSFLDALVVESLHPELQSIVTSKGTPYGKSKQRELSAKIRDLSTRGEATGIEGNMPKGSSRAYIAHADPHNVVIDGQPTKMKTGLKVAIRSTLDKFHDSKEHDGMYLGHLQNEAEGGDHWANTTYRILRHHDGNQFQTNTDSGIFPPLIDHDYEGHEWSHVGHVGNISQAAFKKLTKTESHPEGITHGEFHAALMRHWDRSHGKYWERSETHEARLNHVEEHPLVQRFLDHQGNTNTPPHDYRQLKNLGIWTHPITGEGHIVARDHGYSDNVMKAYGQARTRKWKR